ncbi:hypothetical protein [Puia sp.]|jgi:DNA-binding MarR family transcriptional regulator|uniref:hypothetical protein n=1 Tax=Puia sp. TaxID=2045100 RepID=UPI002F421BF9
MPLYLRNSFAFFEGLLTGRKLIWARIQTEVSITPEGLQNQKFQLERLLTLPVIFVFNRLDSWQRKRLIERQIGFIQTGKQVYIPEWLIQLNDIREIRRNVKHNRDRLSFPAQVAVLSQLQHRPIDGQPAHQIAEKLAYSAMTITRIGRELEQHGVATLQSGKERAFTFREKGEELWRRVLPLLRDPVKEELFAYDLAGIGQVPEAGETALAEYTMLAEGRTKHFAIGKEQYKSLQTLKRLPELNNHQGNYCLQVWNYNPTVIAGASSATVDRLSLYLSLMSKQDERIQAALAEMIKKITW